MPTQPEFAAHHLHLRVHEALYLGIKAIALGEEETTTAIIRQALMVYINDCSPDLAESVANVMYWGVAMENLDVEANIYIAKRLRERAEAEAAAFRHQVT